jgi:flagellar motor switch protein FliN/FliY
VIAIDDDRDHDVLSADALLDVKVRVWAEIGRTRMPLADAVALGAGMLVDLDRGHDEPVDLYVNGLRMGSGHLVTVEGEWAFVVDEVTASAESVERLSALG